MSNWPNALKTISSQSIAISQKAGRLTMPAHCSRRFFEKIEMLERYPLLGDVPKELDALGAHEFRQVLLDPYRPASM